MSTLQRFLSKFVLARKPVSENDWPSVVLLLKEQRPFTSQDAISTGQAAWGSAAPVEWMAITNGGHSYVLKRQPFIFSVHLGSEPYGVPGQEKAQTLQLPWDEHKAWMSIDAPTASVIKLREEESLGDVYKLLLVYAFISWSPNCLGVYFPAECVTIPNLGDLGESIKWGRKNGINLSFLN